MKLRSRSIDVTRARALAFIAALLVLSCRPSTDLVVPPPKLAPTSVEAPRVEPPRADGRLPDEVRPRRYRWTLELDPSGQRFRGEVRIELDVRRPTRSIVLHASGLTLDEVEIGYRDRIVVGKATMRRAAGAEASDGPPEELVVETPEILYEGDAELRIAYRAPLGESLRGLYRVERDSRKYLFTQFEPADARRVLPCFDDPAYKVPFELSVIAPRGQRVFSNSIAVRERDAGEDPESGLPRVRTDFEVTEPLPTYLLALAAGPLDVLEGPKEPVPVRLIAPEGLATRGAFVLSIASELVELFTRRFGTPYPYSKLDLVAVPAFSAGAMENAGLITFREELLLVDANSSAIERRRALLVLAHELAHQWFGNLVTLRWWDDLWLNEGFASYFESVVADEWSPTTNAELGDFVHLGAVMDLDALDAARRVREPVRTVYEAEEAFDAITYSKGSALLGMLHGFLGDEAMGRGIQSYLARHSHGGATSEDFFRALGEAAGLDVGAVARSFVDQPGVPLVRVTPSCSDGVGRVRLEQQRFRRLSKPGDDALWTLPLCLRYAPTVARTVGAVDFIETSRVCTLLTERAKTLELESCPAWVLPNDGHRGYFRYAMPSGSMKELATGLGKGDARSKIGFLSNAWALVEGGELDVVDLMRDIEAWKDDRTLEVVQLMVQLLDRLELAAVDGASAEGFRRWARSVLEPIFSELGWDAEPLEPDARALLRELVIDALSRYEPDKRFRDDAAKRTKSYLRDMKRPGSSAVDAALRAAARTGGVSFESLRDALAAQREPDHRIRVLRALGSFEDPSQILRALDLVADGTVRASDARYLARGAMIGSRARPALVEWLEGHFSTLAEKLGGFGAVGLFEALGRGCSDEERQHAATVYRPLLRQAQMGSRRLDEALEGIAACTELRRRAVAPATRWLSDRSDDRRSR